MTADRKLQALPAAPTLREKLLVSPVEAAELLSLSERRIYELLGRGEIRSHKIGKVRRIPMDALREYVAHLEDDPANAPARIPNRGGKP